MDSTRQDRAGWRRPSSLTPRVERVEFDRNDFTTALIYFKDDMDSNPFRKLIGEFRLATNIGPDWYVRYREAANTYNWFWPTKRILRLTNPLTVQQLTGQTNKLIYLSGNIRGARRFHLRRGVVCNRLLDVDFPLPLVEYVVFDSKAPTLQIKWDQEVSYQGGSGEIIVQSADGTEFWQNTGTVLFVDGNQTFLMELDGPYPGSLLDSGFYQIAAGGFVNIITGKANDQIDHEWNA